jgi:hypothetical protein
VEQFYEKEEVLVRVKEMIGEAVEALEDILPDVAEELGWIRESLLGELIALKSLKNAWADREEAAEQEGFC